MARHITRPHRRDRSRWVRVRAFISDPIGEFQASERLQIWGLVMSAAMAATGLAGLFPEWLQPHAVGMVALAFFIFLTYAHIRTVHRERNQIRDDQTNSASVLSFLRSDVNRLQMQLEAWLHDTSQYQGNIDSIWTRAGEDLRIGMAHGLFQEERHVPLWSCVKVAENSPTTGNATPLGAATFFMAVSWWQLEQENNETEQNERLKFGLIRFAKELDDRLESLNRRLNS